jgi:hypothetical protein
MSLTFGAPPVAAPAAGFDQRKAVAMQQQAVLALLSPGRQSLQEIREAGSETPAAARISAGQPVAPEVISGQLPIYTQAVDPQDPRVRALENARVNNQDKLASVGMQKHTTAAANDNSPVQAMGDVARAHEQAANQYLADRVIPRIGSVLEEHSDALRRGMGRMG